MPASSVARNCTEWSPVAVTRTGSVYGRKLVSSTWYSTVSTPESASVAVTVTVAAPR
ncbi:hypothetical protein NKG94_14780 [Micromonospora sp. M12]